jgi:allantoin racemase
VNAARQGYDAMAITHFQDAALAEVKSVADMPVLGLGETTLFHACTLGRKLGLVTINPAFVPWHEDQVIRYGLQQRVVGVRAVNASVKDFIDAFATPRALKKLKPLWERECRALLAAGADVIVPAGGLPMMLFSGEIDGAPVVNGITLIAKSAEMAVKLRRQAGMFTLSRRSSYAKPPEKALKEFLGKK